MPLNATLSNRRRTDVLAGAGWTRLAVTSSLLTAVLFAATASVVGQSNSNGAVIRRTAVYPRFAYVADATADTISIYSVNASTGQLRHRGYVTAGNDPRSVTIHPSGNFAYVANSGSHDVSTYRIDVTSGALTSSGAKVPAGTNPNSITIAPSGSFAYVANIGSNDLAAYSINATTGALTSIGVPVATGIFPSSVTVDRWASSSMLRTTGPIPSRATRSRPKPGY